jgi:hypothetical protein
MWFKSTKPTSASCASCPSPDTSAARRPGPGPSDSPSRAGTPGPERCGHGLDRGSGTLSWMESQTENASDVYALARSTLPWLPAFLKRVDRRGPDECWPWLGAVNQVSGYGQMGFRPKGQSTTNLYAHRMAWESTYGPIPPHLTIDHRPTCPPLCCNPVHYELVSLAENGRRGNLKRWGFIGNEHACRHGHVGDRAQTSKGVWYCRACERERYRKRKAAA